MAQNTIFSYWNPNDNCYPSTTDLDFGAWYVTHPGTFKNNTYKAGDWLIYFCKARGTKSESKEWRVSNGIVLYNPQTSQSLPKAGFYTKVRLDSKGNVVAGESITYDDLPTKALNKLDLMSQENIQKQAQLVLSKLFDNNTLNPIQFKYDETTGKVTASLKIDEETILVNRNGQLISTAEGSGQTAAVEFDTTAIDKSIEKLKKDIVLISPFEGKGISVKDTIGGKEISVKYDDTYFTLNRQGELTLDVSSLNFSGNVGSNDCGGHEHTADQIKGLDDYIKTYLSTVKITDSLKSSLEEYVDGDTIIIQDGKLTAVSSGTQQHTHVLDDIEDLDKKRLDWATAQRFHTENSNQDPDNGAVLMSTLTVGEILIAFNQLFSQVSKKLENVSALKTEQSVFKPSEPNDISKAVLTLSGSSLNLLDMKDNLSAVQCYKNPVVSTSSRVWSNGHKLHAYVDGKLVETALCYSTDTFGFTSGKQGNFTIELGDAYPEIPLFQGYYQGYSFSYSLSGLEEGEHTVCFVTENLNTKALTYSDKLTVRIYKPVEPKVQISSISTPKVSGYVSGLARHKSQEISVSWRSYTFSKQYARRLQGIFNDEEYESSQFSEEGFTANSRKVWVEKANDKGYYEVKISAKNVEGAESEVQTAKLGPFNFDTTTVEEECRVHLSEIPSNSGKPVRFDDYIYAKDLLSEDYINEGRIINNIATVADKKPEMQYVAFRFDVPYVSNFYVDLKDADGNAFEEERDGTMKNMQLYFGISTSNSVAKWIDGNSPYAGYGNNDKSFMFSGLDLFRSTKVRRWMTLGKGPLYTTGTLYIVVGYTSTVDLKALVDSVKECIDERE